jgi:SAM-dependent methyltransferase
MTYSGLRGLIPGSLRAWILHFETSIERATGEFAASLGDGVRVLDAGAGEAQYAHLFSRQRYVGVDLGIGDASWNYRRLDCIADLQALPLREASCDACLNIVTLEHVREPGRVICELGRVLKPGGRLLLIVPHEWEVHQSPHDYYRYTRHGVRYLLDRAGFESVVIEPVGGFFRLLSRRLWNALQFFPGPLMLVAALFFAPPALLLPLFDSLDRERNFTLGYICTASKS